LPGIHPIRELFSELLGVRGSVSAASSPDDPDDRWIFRLADEPDDPPEAETIGNQFGGISWISARCSGVGLARAGCVVRLGSVRAPTPWRDPPPGLPPEPSVHRRQRIQLYRIIPLLVVGALVLESSADILPSQGIVGPITLGRTFLIFALIALVAAGARGGEFRTGLDLPIAVLVLATGISTYQHPGDGAALRFLLTAVAFYYVTVGLFRLDAEAKVALPLLALVAVSIPTAVGLSQLSQHVPTTFYRRGLFTPVDSDRLLPGLQIRAIGTFTNPNLLAAYLLLLTPFAALAAGAARRYGARTAVGGLAALAYVGVLITFSRAAVAAVFVSLGLAALALLARRPRRRKLSHAAWPALAVTAAGLLVTGLSGALGRVSGRGQAFSLATRALHGHLATGVGPRRAGAVMTALGHTNPPYSHTHNLWLNWLVETGVAGFAAIALITVLGLVAAARTAAAGYPLGVAGLAALSGFYVMSLVDNPANAERVSLSFWFVLGLVMADTRPGRLSPRSMATAVPDMAEAAEAVGVSVGVGVGVGVVPADLVVSGHVGPVGRPSSADSPSSASRLSDDGLSAPPTIPIARRPRGQKAAHHDRYARPDHHQRPDRQERPDRHERRP